MSEIDFAQANDDEEGDEEPDIDSLGEVRCAPVARRLNKDEAFQIALERMPGFAVVTLDDLLDGRAIHPDVFRLAEPHMRELLAMLRR